MGCKLSSRLRQRYVQVLGKERGGRDGGDCDFDSKLLEGRTEIRVDDRTWVWRKNEKRGLSLDTRDGKDGDTRSFEEKNRRDLREKEWRPESIDTLSLKSPIVRGVPSGTWWVTSLEGDTEVPGSAQLSNQSTGEGHQSQV